MAQVIQPADVRSRLREALELDLIGPGAGHPLADERLPGWVRPSNWYLTGFLVPRGRRRNSARMPTRTTISSQRSRMKAVLAMIPRKTADRPRRASFRRRWA